MFYFNKEINICFINIIIELIKLFPIRSNNILLIDFFRVCNNYVHVIFVTLIKDYYLKQRKILYIFFVDTLIVRFLNQQKTESEFGTLVIYRRKERSSHVCLAVK